MHKRSSNIKKWFVKGRLLVLLAGVVFMVFYFPHYTKLRHLREANRNLQHQIHTLEEEIEKLEEKIKVVGQDPYLYEEIAREQLGAVKKHEVVIEIQE